MRYQQSRRGFVGAVALGAVAVGAHAAFRLAVAGDDTPETGLVTVADEPAGASAMSDAAADTPWHAAIGSIAHITGEAGTVAARIVDVQTGRDGGERPAMVRAHSLTVVFEVDADVAPAGDRIYGFASSAITDVHELFLQSGDTAYGRTALTAILN